MTQEIPIVFAVDVEPDQRETDIQSADEWVGFTKTHSYLTDLRGKLEHATGTPVRYSWFLRMDPQIKHVYGTATWVANRYQHLIEQIVAADDELGLHTHAFRWEDSCSRWIADHGDPVWVDYCVTMSLNAFELSFGRKAESFRFGDRFMSNRTMRLLEANGVKYDLTQEPNKIPRAKLWEDELHTGSLPDYRPTPRHPFRPSLRDFRRPGRWLKRNLWAIPLSTGANPGQSDPGADACALNLASPSTIFQAVMDWLLQSLRRPFLVMVIRTNTTIDPNYRMELTETVRYIFSHPMLSRFRFVTPQELIRNRPWLVTRRNGGNDFVSVAKGTGRFQRLPAAL